MAFTYPTMEYWLLIPKILNCFLFAILSIKILKIRKYIVNKLFFTAFILWAFYILGESIIYLTGANSEAMLHFANIFRDLQMIAIFFVAYSMFYATNVIRFGESSIDRKKMKIVLGILFGCLIPLIIIDKLEVLNELGEVITVFPPTGEIHVFADLHPLVVVFSIFPLILYIMSLIDLRKIAKSANDPLKKKKLYYLLFGISLLPCGIIFFIVINALSIYSILTSSFGHILWAMAPVFVWIGERK